MKMKIQKTHLRRITRETLKNGWDPVSLASQESIISKSFLVVLGKEVMK